MSKLYLHIYFAVLGSLVVLAVAIGLVVHATYGPPSHGTPAHVTVMVLGLLAAAVAAGAYPIVRGLTRRLERLQAGVESLGAGDLGARVAVEGRDEVARLAQSFNRAAARIEELVGAHKSLLANASHELRTPLARIRVALELLPSSLDAERRAGIETDIAELDALIGEILLASRLDATDAPESDEPVDLLALAAEECAPYPEAALDGAPVTGRGDARLLRRLLRNLLENARRHGRAPVRVSVARDGARSRRVVAHAGEPIPAAESERIFEPFYRRADGAGAGLGLALVRQIARRHGGEARCESGGGTRFVVDLPA